MEEHSRSRGGHIRSKDILANFPFLGEVPPGARAEFSAHAVRKTLEHKQMLVTGGHDCEYLPFVLQGTLRVYKMSESGKELTLYRIEEGESCVLSATCILNESAFPAMVEAEGKTEMVLVPSRLFARWVEEYPPWRRFVFGIYEKRLEVLLSVVEEVAFHHVDARVSGWLSEAAAGRSVAVRATHQKIASEVGTSREVVSRILRDFESEGLLVTERGRIRILDPRGLSARGEQSPRL